MARQLTISISNSVLSEPLNADRLGALRNFDNLAHRTGFDQAKRETHPQTDNPQDIETTSSNLTHIVFEVASIDSIYLRRVVKIYFTSTGLSRRLN
jgi:hypothetical protein